MKDEKAIFTLDGNLIRFCERVDEMEDDKTDAGQSSVREAFKIA